MYWGGVFLLSLTSCDSAVRTYTVTFNPENGSESWIVTVPERTLIEEPSAPRRSGYSFLGWYIEASGTKYNFTTPITSDMILEARWSRNITYYTVTFDGNKPKDATGEIENLPATVSIASGEIIGDKISPTLDGYTFTGWYTDAAAQTAFNLTTDPVTKNLELFAGWSKASYTIKFDLRLPDDLDPDTSIQAPSSQTVQAGEALQAIAPLTLSETIYTFGSWWYEAEDGTETKIEDLTLFIPEKDMTIYAKWDVDNHPWDGSSIVTMHIIQQADDTDNIIEIRTAAELAGLARIVNGDEDVPDGFNRTFNGKTIRIMNDIDLNDKPWSLIGKTGNLFQASTIEGNPEKESRTAIIGLMNDEADGRYHIGGLFGRMSSSYPVNIKNISISGKIEVTTSFGNNSSAQIGGLIAYMTVPSVTFDNCSFEEGEISVTGPDGYTIGGLAGYILSTSGDVTFNNCEVGNLTISGDTKTKFIGGLAGSIQTTSYNISFSNCTSKASMTTDNTATSIGFLAGAGYPATKITITNCNDVSGNGYKEIGNKN